MIPAPHILVLPSFYPTELDYPRGNFFQEQTRMLAKQGVQVAVVYTERRSLASLSWKRIKFAHFQTTWKTEHTIPTLRRRAWNVIPTRFELGESIWVRQTIKLVEQYMKKNGKPDLIHAHCIVSAGIVARHIQKKYNIPYIVTEHSALFEEKNIKQRSIVKYRDVIEGASKFVVVSNPFLQLLTHKLNIAAKGMEVVPNFIDVDFFKPAVTSGAPIKNKKIFSVCYHVYEKRLDRLIKAFAGVRKVYPDAQLVIGGEGPATADLKKLASDLGLTDAVEFTGFLSPQSIKEHLSACNLFVLPSDNETFGVVLIEAMAMGVPVVATKSGGPEDIITEETGQLVEKNVEGVEQGILRILSNREIYNPDKIRMHVLNSFSGHIVSKRYIDLYSQCIEQAADTNQL